MLAVELAVWGNGLDDPKHPFERLGRLSQDMSRKFRAMGIMQLLTEGNSDAFFHHQIRSGRARLKYLERARSEGKTDDFFQASGRYHPLMSAIAAGDWPLARQIASLGADHQLNGEYEDDHCVAQIIRRLIEAYLEGGPDPRFPLLSAIAKSDQAEFDDAFAAEQAEFDAQVKKAIDRQELEEPVTLALREVDVDGLAFLKLAELRALVTEDDYPFCPSIARVPMVVPFPGI
jgi:hypothetical protein